MKLLHFAAMEVLLLRSRLNISVMDVQRQSGMAFIVFKFTPKQAACLVVLLIRLEK